MGSAENPVILEPFLSKAKPPQKCVVCIKEFIPSTSRAKTCCPECRRVWNLRYGAAYREEGRRLRAQLRTQALELFGSEPPPYEEILRFFRNRKGRR